MNETGRQERNKERKMTNCVYGRQYIVVNKNF